MRIDFYPRLEFSWVAAAVGVGSLAYGIVKSAKAKKAQQKMQALADQQKPDKGITDYYKSALQRYNTDPYQSQFYQQAKQGVDRNLATGINSLQSRRSAVGGISALVSNSNDALRNAGVGAENMRNQTFGQLGQAAGINAQENKYPLEMKYNLAGAQAAGYNQAANSAFQSAYNGLGTVGSYLAMNKKYGGNSGGNGNYGGSGGSGYYSNGNYTGE